MDDMGDLFPGIRPIREAGSAKRLAAAALAAVPHAER